MLPLIGNIIMICIGLAFVYLAVHKKYEPLLLLPIGFGAVLVNIPGSTLMGGVGEGAAIMKFIYDNGVANGLFPVLIFIGVGAMIDFGPLLERPKLLILALAGQLGIFLSLTLAIILGFAPNEASSIGIIGAMDGPSAIFVTSQFAPNLLAPIIVCAYSYMALVPVIQHPIMRALTTQKERKIRMKYEPVKYSKRLKIAFPIIVTLITCTVAPGATPLIGALMLGNLMKESGVVDRLAKAAENEISNAVTLLLGLTIGALMSADVFLTAGTLKIFALGIVAFSSAIAFGVISGKIMAKVTRGEINPLIGACGISAYPMAARAVHIAGRKEDPDNWLLMHAMAVNTGGQIASVIATGVILTFAPLLAPAYF